MKTVTRAHMAQRYGRTYVRARQAEPQRVDTSLMSQLIYVGPAPRRPSLLRTAWATIRRYHYDHALAALTIIGAIALAGFVLGGKP